MTTTATKLRIDAWDAPLTEEQRWRAYGQMARAPWYEVAAWVAEEFGIAAPSRSAMYRWAARMRAAESEHRLAKAVQARAEVAKLAGTVAAGDDLIQAYQSLAAEMALSGNAQDAVRLTQMAMQIAGQQTAKAELALKRQRLAQQQDAQRLAREKWEAAEARLTAVKDALSAAKSKGGLTPETLKQIEEAAGLL